MFDSYKIRELKVSKSGKEFHKNILENNKRAEEAYLQELDEQKAQKEAAKKSRPTKRNIVLKGVELSDEQQKTLKGGGHIFLENMTTKDGKIQFSAYAFLNEEKNHVFFCEKNPDELVKYGKYEMRIRDKILIENGYVTKAKVKWWGEGSYAHPYLWKANKSDSEYKESWDDSKVEKAQKTEQKLRQPVIQKKNRGQKR